MLVAGGITVSIIAFVFTIKFLCELAARVVSFLQNEDPGRRGDRSIYDYVRGNYLDPRSCKVSWDWKEPQEVGQTMSFRVQVRKLLTTLIPPRFLCSHFLNYTSDSIFSAVLQKWPTFPCPSTCRAEGQHHSHRTGSGHPRYTGSPSRSRVQYSQSSLHCAEGWTL